MTSSAILFAYFPYFSNTNISGTNADNCKQQTAFFSFMEFYVIHLKNQGVKFWSQYHFKSAGVIPQKWPYLSFYWLAN